MGKMTGLIHGNSFYQTWDHMEPVHDEKTGEPGFHMITIVEKAAYDKCLLDLNEMTTKFSMAMDEANKYRNIYSAEAVTTLVLSTEIQDLQEKVAIKLWGLTIPQVFSLMNFYEAQSGNKAQDIK